MTPSSTVDEDKTIVSLFDYKTIKSGNQDQS